MKYCSNEPYAHLHHNIKMAQRVEVLCTATIERAVLCYHYIYVMQQGAS